MFDLDTREWLLTNGLGGFASGTDADVHTRTYHGWLFAATNPPSGRKLLLSHLEASLEIRGKVIELGTNLWGTGKIEPTGYKFLQQFDHNPVPKWVWSGDNWQLSRRLVMPNWGLGTLRQAQCIAGDWGLEGDRVKVCSNNQRVLIEYRYEGKEEGILRLRLFIGDRNFHHQQIGNKKIQFSQLLHQNILCLQMNNWDNFGGNFGTPWHLRWTQGKYQVDGLWYWNYSLPAETKRGLGDRQDLYSPGYLTVNLQPGDTVTLEAKVGFPDSQENFSPDSFTEAVVTEQARIAQIFGWGNEETGKWGENSSLTLSSLLSPVTCHLSPIQKQLLKASDQFIVYRDSIASPTVIAGYHWFNDWGRDTLIALPGLTLVTGRFEIAKGLLKTFGSYCRHGLIPNTFPDVDNEPFYNSIDAALWWIEILGLYLETTQDWQFLLEQFPIVQQIHKAFVSGTRYNIQVDAIDGLVSWDAQDVALTWMDALVEGIPVTPRCGKAVEINALWYSALCWLSKWSEHLSHEYIDHSSRLISQKQRYQQQAELVKISLQKFWHPQLGYLYDLIDLEDSRNSQIRPNAILALSLHHCAFSQQQGQKVLDLATSRLLTPYGLRSLDPSDPEYQGKCEGSPQKRDRAYHQGTVWTWLIGAYIRAWERFYPETPLPFDWKPLLDHFSSNGCLGSISEIFDGDAPHTPRGAIAQAWSVAEVIRHYK
ncbi:glycogen debranching enzyme N-terminal domain-containing protein [Anabaena aphanizomenioides LEGE 00250]|uniref:Glycogen debranching enzyme N-terminal domain-containing protein n=1 Tax=Sphaerospermopsis aphanizomenoides LEGE 00250 TaxID=2777972 RepID=A0ABR9VK93_9CYAN|nr:amylo-alpha-1,6-glucosidase [Sphaerospermopsis aphanizomenoides]MBE9238926.1 glycogen debranching enzyme N-terminal domain-containing protein [Sphaerospermopsis aphanizomenoides LEGE 00250]